MRGGRPRMSGARWRRRLLSAFLDIAPLAGRRALSSEPPAVKPTFLTPPANMAAEGLGMPITRFMGIKMGGWWPKRFFAPVEPRLRSGGSARLAFAKPLARSGAGDVRLVVNCGPPRLASTLGPDSLGPTALSREILRWAFNGSWGLWWWPCP